MDRTEVLLLALALLVVFAFCVFRLRRIHALPQDPGRKWRRIAERSFLWLVMVFIVAAGCGTVFNALAVRHYRALYPPPGTIYAVNGYKMHLYCTGSGSPTIVLDAGLGNDSLIWARVQPELSKTTRVCSYDRAGFGWSEIQPGPRDANHITDQLHMLLMQAGVTGPVVLMGHSIAGIYIRDYATRYPQNIAGLVFVDGSTPLQEDRFSPQFRAFVKKATYLESAVRWAYVLGVSRVLGQCSQIPPGFETYRGWWKADSCIPSQMTQGARELANMRNSGNETIHSGPYGDLPILIFSHDPSHAPPAIIPKQLAAQEEIAWNEMQEDLKQLSTRSRRIIAKGSTHYVQIDRPHLVNSQVKAFIEQIRGDAPQPTDYGSTKTE